MVKCLPEFEYFNCILEILKLKNISKIRRSKVTDYAALNVWRYFTPRSDVI